MTTMRKRKGKKGKRPQAQPRQKEAATGREPWRERLARLKAEVGRAQQTAVDKLHAARERSPHWLGMAVLGVVRIAVIVTAPFVVLVRGAVWLYEAHSVPAWSALLLSGWATLLLLALYGAWLAHRFTGRARMVSVAKWIAAPLVIGYCGYALLYLSRINAKDDAIRSVYTSLHPLLRVALSTLILADHNAVITDAARTPDDYTRMGLRVNQRSMHYRQPDGWIHAVDLRTRSPFRSVLVEWYFWAMGFDTLRHTGTADHLHVQLVLKE